MSAFRLDASIRPWPRRMPPETRARGPSRPGEQTPPADACARDTTSDSGFVTRDQWKKAPSGLGSGNDER
jgi:hypothetical protein